MKRFLAAIARATLIATPAFGDDNPSHVLTPSSAGCIKDIFVRVLARNCTKVSGSPSLSTIDPAERSMSPHEHVRMRSRMATRSALSMLIR